MRRTEGRTLSVSELKKATLAWLLVGSKEPEETKPARTMAEEYVIWRKTKEHYKSKPDLCALAVRYAKARKLKLFKSEMYGY